MLHEGIAEAFHHIAGEFLQLVLGQVAGGKKFLEHHLVHELAHLGILAAFLDSIETAQIAHGTQYGMGAIEEGYLTLVVRSLGRHEEHVEARFVGREFGGDFLGSLDDPEMENLGLVQETVVVTDTLAELGGGVTRITGNDAVHEGAVHAAALLKPGAEVRTQVPQVDILTDAFLEVPAVFEDKLAREKDEALVPGAFEILETVIQQLRELAGIGAGGLVGKFAGRVEGDACLGGIGNYKADFRLFGQLEVLLKLSIGVQSAGNHVNQVHAVHRLSVLEPLKIQVIEAVLFVEPFHHALLDGLNHHHGAVEVRLLVGFPDNPLDECAKEVALAKLNHLFGVLLCLRCRRSIKSFHICVL